MSLCRAANGARALFRGRSAGGEAAAAHAAVATVARLYSLCLTGGDPRFFDRLGAGKRRVRRSTALTAAFAAVPYPTSASEHRNSPSPRSSVQTFPDASAASAAASSALRSPRCLPS